MKSLKPFRSLASRHLRPEELGTIYRLLRNAFGHQHWWPGESPFEVMIGAILTQNTAWANVEKAIRNLKDAHQLTPQALRVMTKPKLARLIRPAGYFNIKADRIKHFISFLFSEYRGSLKRMFSEKGESLRQKLLALKGIGPETADSILLYAAQKPFFVIDAYTRRIFGRHGLYDPSKTYEDWRILFEKFLPRTVGLFNDFHAQIVYLGKNFCKTKPQCASCPLQRFL
ncbi:MAG: endonuclease III domain-containing protein [Candidatus Omnitrophica bacterium]|nr:endonuclease III domain-containing protein [Candidatus Omnitrophota bacterium]